MTPKESLIIALDFAELAPARELARVLAPEVGMLKVGLELFDAEGPQAIRELRALGARIFCDVKLCDIPNTVAGAAAALGRLGVAMLNVHALGGKVMMAAAKEAAARGAQQAGLPPPLVIGVTVLTSLADQEVEEVGLLGSASEAALRLARLAVEAGLDGVVCAVPEVADVKRTCGKDFLTVTPGIRPLGAARGDQLRTATPAEARAQGADYLVVGRPVTQAANSRQAVFDILAEMGAEPAVDYELDLLLGTTIDSLTKLGVVLHLHTRPTEVFAPEALATALRRKSDLVQTALEELAEAGLVKRFAVATGRHAVYSAREDERLATVIERLRVLYDAGDESRDEVICRVRQAEGEVESRK